MLPKPEAGPMPGAPPLDPPLPGIGAPPPESEDLSREVIGALLSFVAAFFNLPFEKLFIDPNKADLPGSLAVAGGGGPGAGGGGGPGGGGGGGASDIIDINHANESK